MDKLLNRIKLIIAPYLKRDMDCSDFKKGGMYLAREIADAIDVVSDDNLQISKIDVGETIVNKTLIGRDSAGPWSKQPGNLQFIDEDIEIYCKSIPFIREKQDNGKVNGGYYKITIQKIQPSTEELKKDAEEPMPEDPNAGKRRKLKYADFMADIAQYQPVGNNLEQAAQNAVRYYYQADANGFINQG